MNSFLYFGKQNIEKRSNISAKNMNLNWISSCQNFLRKREKYIKYTDIFSQIYTHENKVHFLLGFKYSVLCFL